MNEPNALKPFAARVPFLSPNAAIEVRERAWEPLKTTRNNSLLHQIKLFLYYFTAEKNRYSDKKGTPGYRWCQKKSTGGVTKKGRILISCRLLADFFIS